MKPKSKSKEQRLIEQVIYLTRRVYELEQKVGISDEVRLAHLNGLGDVPHFRASEVEAKQ